MSTEHTLVRTEDHEALRTALHQRLRGRPVPLFLFDDAVWSAASLWVLLRAELADSVAPSAEGAPRSALQEVTSILARTWSEGLRGAPARSLCALKPELGLEVELDPATDRFEDELLRAILRAELITVRGSGLLRRSI